MCYGRYWTREEREQRREVTARDLLDREPEPERPIPVADSEPEVERERELVGAER